jgi:hypothetical protein
MGTTYHNKPIVTDGLVFYADAANKESYPGSGADINDLVGVNTGSLSSSPTFEDVNGGVLDLDGSDQIIFDNPYSMSGGSVSIWFKREGSGTAGMIGTYDGGNKRSPTIYFSSGNIGWEFGNLSGQDSGVTFPTGFENYVITYDSSFNVVIYAGGVQIDSGTSTSIANFWDYFTIGKYGNYSSLYMGGKFGCVSVYNRALSASEVTQNYNALKNRFI